MGLWWCSVSNDIYMVIGTGGASLSMYRDQTFGLHDHGVEEGDVLCGRLCCEIDGCVKEIDLL